MIINFIKKYWFALRLSEVILMSGFFIIGSFFSISAFDSKVIMRLAGLFLLSFCIVLSIYSFNAASGKEKDKNNLRLQNLWNFSIMNFLILSLSFFLLSILIGCFLDKSTPLFTIVIIALWVLYSHPVYGLKQKAVYGTLIHFIGQIIHFLMAWLVFRPFNTDALLISIFFAIAFSSGHLLHEIMDAEADKTSGFQTSPVKYGIKKTAGVLITLLIINSVLWVCLYGLNIINIQAFFSFLPATLIHLTLAIIFYGKIIIKATLIRYVYRVFYFLGGIVYLTLSLINGI